MQKSNPNRRSRYLTGPDRDHLLLAKSRGLIEALSDANLIPETEFFDDELSQILTVTTENFLTAPTCEWTFGMFIDAAICTLKVQQLATKYGFTLRDAHYQNVVYNCSVPVFIDMNSFVKSDQKRRWVASGEYRTEIRRPLRIIMGGHFSIVRKILQNPETLPRERLWTIQYPILFRILKITNLDNWIIKAREQLALIGVFNFQNAVINAANLSNDEFIVIANKLLQITKWKAIVLKLVANLFSVEFEIKPDKEIARLNKWAAKSNDGYWSNYYNDSIDQDISDDIMRLKRIHDLVIDLKPSSITDVGGNNGKFIDLFEQDSRISKKVLIDSDEKSIEFARKNNKFGGSKFVIGVVDVAHPALSYYGVNSRYVSECACALALTHHLVLRFRLTFDEVVERLKTYTSKYLLVEFMPLGLWDGSSAPPVPDWYNESNFATALGVHFSIRETLTLNDNRVLFIAELKHQPRD
jgi:hypothetical protein